MKSWEEKSSGGDRGSNIICRLQGVTGGHSIGTMLFSHIFSHKVEENA